LNPPPATVAIAGPAGGQPPGPAIRMVAPPRPGRPAAGGSARPAGRAGRPRRTETARPVQETAALPAVANGAWFAALAGCTSAPNLLRSDLAAGPSAALAGCPGPDGIVTAAADCAPTCR